MITYKTETTLVQIPAKIVCDVCKKVFDGEKGVMEIQEFQCIRIHGGYDSIFGDGRKVNLDICQHCLKELLGKYFVYENYEKD